MKNIPVSTPRCRGYDGKTGETCRIRDRCARHLQLARDRDLSLPEGSVKIMSLPYVPGSGCHYRMPEAA